ARARIMLFAKRRLARLDDQPLLQHALNRSVERAGAHTQFPAGAFLDVLDDRVAVAGLLSQREEDVERCSRKGQEAVGFVHGPFYSHTGYIATGYRRKRRPFGLLAPAQ